ncbi:CC157 protein, partial [Baryphthengus martii]|nr:CC157 protein [Baryphthengus martii]
MAHLLGHPGSMETLRTDLWDLQAAVTDVSSCAGALRCPSWKFPEKAAADLDVAELLECYNYQENDPEFTQHSHVVLLELVIDRLLLLLQSFTGYIELLLSKRDVPPVQTVGPSTSMGLMARRCWANMVKLGASYQELLPEKVTCRKEIPQLPPGPWSGKPEKSLKARLSDLFKLRSPRGVTPSASKFPSLSVHRGDGDSLGSSLPQAAHSMAESGCSVPTQVAGSPLGLCDTCATAQGSLLQVGHAIASICQSQNIPSALGRLQEEGKIGMRRTLSASDISSWALDQGKDLTCINRHLQTLLQQITPLKAALAQAEKEKEELRGQVEDFSRSLQAERESQAQQRKEAERSLALKTEEHSAAIARLEQEKYDLQRGTVLLGQLPCLCLEANKAALLEEARSSMAARRHVLKLERKLQLLSGQRKSLAQEMNGTAVELAKERAKVQSVHRHQEEGSFPRWLPGLLGGSPRLSCPGVWENALQTSAPPCCATQELLNTLRQEKLNLEQPVSELQDSVSDLEEQARKLRERERLLLSFAELHASAETPVESTGSVSEDTEQQVPANSIHIGVLEGEKARLGSAPVKLKAAAGQGVLR